MKTTQLPPKHLRLMVGDNYSVCRFDELSRPFRLSIAHYMAIDGEAWDADLKIKGLPSPQKLVAALTQALPAITRSYGSVCFGRAMLKASSFKTALLASASIRGEGITSFEGFVAACRKSTPPTLHPRTHRWPVILSNFSDEVLQDGWHRMGCYLARGDAMIPAVFYL